MKRIIKFLTISIFIIIAISLFSKPNDQKNTPVQPPKQSNQSSKVTTPPLENSPKKETRKPTPVESTPTAQKTPQKEKTVVTKGNRLIGIDVNTDKSGDFPSALKIAKTAGMNVISLSLFWDEIETEKGKYNPATNWLSIANSYYPKENLKVLLSLTPIDTIKLHLPADLMGKDIDDPEVIARFNNFLDYVFSQIPDLQLSALAIGNEADSYLGSNHNLWTKYHNFFSATAKHARELRPGLKVGVQITYDGAMSRSPKEVATLNDLSDVMIISYYPITSDFKVKSNDDFQKDWENLMRAYGDKPIMFGQIGFPSSTLNNSSETKQKEFVEKLFELWDSYKNQVPLIVFIRLHDSSSNEVDAWKSSYYGINDPKFSSFLDTLGLRTEKGLDKEAFTDLKKEAEVRGW
jgi:hypothetical protein